MYKWINEQIIEKRVKYVCFYLKQLTHLCTFRYTQTCIFRLEIGFLASMIEFFFIWLAGSKKKTNIKTICKTSFWLCMRSCVASSDKRNFYCFRVKRAEITVKSRFNWHSCWIFTHFYESCTRQERGKSTGGETEKENSPIKMHDTFRGTSIFDYFFLLCRAM